MAVLDSWLIDEIAERAKEMKVEALRIRDAELLSWSLLEIGSALSTHGLTFEQLAKGKTLKEAVRQFRDQVYARGDYGELINQMAFISSHYFGLPPEAKHGPAFEAAIRSHSDAFHAASALAQIFNEDTQQVDMHELAGALHSENESLPHGRAAPANKPEVLVVASRIRGHLEALKAACTAESIRETVKRSLAKRKGYLHPESPSRNAH